MQTARAFTLIDAGVIAASGLALAALADITAFTPRPQLIAQSLNNLRAIGSAAGQYRADNNGYLPIEGLAGQRRPAAGAAINGWAGWSFAGKNNDPWWAQGSGLVRFFDIEAADRPLNSYLYPGVTFYAPPLPKTLPADDPAREQQAPVNRDPSDYWTYERKLHAIAKGISTYQDVGTSYHWNGEWWVQLASISDWTQRMRAGTLKLATGDGVIPSRFVWCYDSMVSQTVHSPEGRQLQNWYGEYNKSVMLFMDGRADYLATFPGATPQSFINEWYALRFE